MADRDRKIIETLATKLMGWKKTSGPLFGKYIAFLRANGTYAVEWNPFTDWRAAGEVLEAMRQRPNNVWEGFVSLIHATTDLFVLRGLSPRLIAEAAFEALREPDGDAT